MHTTHSTTGYIIHDIFYYIRQQLHTNDGETLSSARANRHEEDARKSLRNPPDKECQFEGKKRAAQGAVTRRRRR